MTTPVTSFVDYLDATWSEERMQSEMAVRAARACCTQGGLLDAVALEIARRFDHQKLSQGEAMAMATALYNAVLGHSEVPRQLYAVYWALDEAEYGSEQDDPQDEDAPSKRAREAVRAILAAVPRDDA